jgi:hypothetical protein
VIDPGRLLIVVDMTGARFPSRASTPGVSVTGGVGAVAPVARAGVTDRFTAANPTVHKNLLPIGAPIPGYCIFKHLQRVAAG